MKQPDASSQVSTLPEKKIRSIAELKTELKASFSESTTRVLDIMIGHAVSLFASDLHIEPQKETAKLRVRIDGVLQDVLEISQELYESILSRIKLVSGIKLNVTDRPQDGRFSVVTKEKTPIEIRVSTIPAEYGESVVLRMLNPKTLVNMEELGLRNDLLKLFERELKRPNGMVIVTGPTGSGKTTTLYAFLKKVQKSEIKIITIEDPIEYHLEGISQTQTKPKEGYDFAKGLKSIMRQDPDVILVGEIRDLETADISIQAALTGHLVLSTLHTNDAAGTIARLTSLGAKPVNIAPALNIAVAQRLVRRVCKKCAQFEKISANTLRALKKTLGDVPKTVEIPQLTGQTKIPQVKGCQDCNHTGYFGRIGIFEAMLIDSEMEKFILTNPSISAVEKEALKQGMVSMKQDGMIKVLQGVTTIEEVERVTGV